MKVKPNNRGGVAVELRSDESQLPGSAPGVLPAFQLKKILVPVDYSERSKKALQYAMPFAKQFGAQIVLLHLVEPYPQIPEMAPVDVENLADARKQMGELKKTIDKSVPIESVIRVGVATAGIVEAAKELDIDLVILATQGRSGLAHVLLGSTAERVVRHAPCPVLVVREREREFVACAPFEAAVAN